MLNYHFKQLLMKHLCTVKSSTATVLTLIKSNEKRKKEELAVTAMSASVLIW